MTRITSEIPPGFPNVQGSMGGGSCHAKSGPQPFSVRQVSTDSKYASIIHTVEQAEARITSEIPPGFPEVQGSMGGGSCHAKSGPQSFSVSQVSTDSKYASIIHNGEQAKARITSEIPPGFPEVQGSMGGGSCHAKSGPQSFSVRQVSTDSKYASIMHNVEKAKARITSEISPGFPDVFGSMGGGSCHAKSGP